MITIPSGSSVTPIQVIVSRSSCRCGIRTAGTPGCGVASAPTGGSCTSHLIPPSPALTRLLGTSRSASAPTIAASSPAISFTPSFNGPSATSPAFLIPSPSQSSTGNRSAALAGAGHAALTASSPAASASADRRELARAREPARGAIATSVSWPAHRAPYAAMPGADTMITAPTAILAA